MVTAPQHPLHVVTYLRLFHTDIIHTAYDVKGTVSRDLGIFLMDIHRKSNVSRSTADILKFVMSCRP
jgi:hypothetical protein